MSQKEKKRAETSVVGVLCEVRTHCPLWRSHLHCSRFIPSLNMNQVPEKRYLCQWPYISQNIIQSLEFVWSNRTSAGYPPPPKKNPNKNSKKTHPICHSWTFSRSKVYSTNSLIDRKYCCIFGVIFVMKANTNIAK